MHKVSDQPGVRIGALGPRPSWLSDGGVHRIEESVIADPGWQLIVSSRRLTAGEVQPGQVVLYCGPAVLDGLDPDADHTALLVELPGRVLVAGSDEIACVVAEVFIDECDYPVHRVPLEKLNHMVALSGSVGKLRAYQKRLHNEVTALCGESAATDVLRSILDEF